MTLCAAAEFLARDDGLPGLEEAYGFTFGDDVSELELGLVYTSIDEGDPCTFGEVFATDGRIAAAASTIAPETAGDGSGSSRIRTRRSVYFHSSTRRFGSPPLSAANASSRSRATNAPPQCACPARKAG